jgi:DNA gyrase subunit A
LATDVQNIPPFNNTNVNILPIELNDELKTSFMSYAMSTILGRALPDVRDGLKPVHRRVLYAMNLLNLTPDSSYRKCARIVGEVLGKFHPHGDQSVYDALVRMAQDFVMLHPLVEGSVLLLYCINNLNDVKIKYFLSLL